MHMVIPSMKGGASGSLQALQVRVVAPTGDEDRGKIEPTQVPGMLCYQREMGFPRGQERGALIQEITNSVNSQPRVLKRDAGNSLP